MARTTDEITSELRGFSDTPALDAREYARVGAGLSADEFIARRRAGEPVSKILGRRGFWKGAFIVTPDVLDPRADSETVIESVLKHFPDTARPHRILDIGTGSGCLLVSLLSEYKNAAGIGIDKSEKALDVARQNACQSSIELKQRDFAADDLTDLGCFDIIVSNPPYIPTAEIARLDVGVRQYDPAMALDGGADGLDAYRALARICPALLNPNGLVFLEIGQGQGADVRALMAGGGCACIAAHADLGGIERVLVFRLLS